MATRRIHSSRASRHDTQKSATSNVSSADLPPQSDSVPPREGAISETNTSHVVQLLQQFEQDAHPLVQRAHDTHLKTMRADWAPFEQKIDRVLELCGDVAERRADARDEDDAEEEDRRLAALEGDVFQLIDLKNEVEWRRKILADMRDMLAQGEEISDASQLYQHKLSTLQSEYKTKSNRQRYAGSKDFEQYKSRVWDALHEEPMPPLGDLLGGEGEQSSDDDDDEVAVYGGTRHNFKCPLSLQIMVHPLRSKVCQHAFESEAILNYLGGATKPCPTQCQAMLQRSKLVEDPSFTRACRNHARRVERRREREREQNQATLLD